ncbi:MAG: hypothetical protein WC242_03650 [Candidatus Paceibacterota bacterium]|jgi:hypothetical protein
MSLTQIQILREKYKPLKIKYLIIAESPPLCEDSSVRFFYNPSQEKYDFMFRAIMETIFSDFKNKYRKGDKNIYLERFKSEGFYMIDSTDDPINRLNEKDRNKKIILDSKKKIIEIKKLISKETPIFLIKKNVFEIFSNILKKQGYNVVNNEFIPFPGFGNQLKFKEVFKKYLTKVYNYL